MRPSRERDVVRDLAQEGQGDCAIARRTGIPRSTIRDWRRDGCPSVRIDPACPRCAHATLAESSYAYLLGLYLGDGCLSVHRRAVYKLRITLDSRYPRIIDECADTMALVSANRAVERVGAKGCVVVGCYWKHWPCLFPQHGPGPKHMRAIRLARWQEETVARWPGRLLRGLIHSDGTRVMNRVGDRAYPRYFFTNHSADILQVFCHACDRAGVRWTRPTWKQVSVARAAHVATLDRLIGPKR